MAPRTIIDSHVHLSKYAHDGKSFAQIRDRLLASMDRHGVSSVVVLPDSETGTGVADLDTTIELTLHEPRLHSLGTAAIDSLDAALVNKLRGLASDRLIFGIKLYPGFEPFYPTDTRCQPLYDLCVHHDLPVLFHSGQTMNDPERMKFNHPDEIAKLAARMPELRIVVAHFSQPALAECRDALIAHPNVYADISGLAHPSVMRRCGAETIAETVVQTVATRPDGVLYATDWPLCDVAAHIAFVESLRVPDDVKNRVLSQNAARVFRLDSA